MKYGDLIDRQAAVDAVAKGLKGVFVEYQDVAEKLLNNVPSVQPEPPEDICGECDAWNKYKSEIKALPSAQPEHTETHSCDCECTETHYSRREWYMKGYRDAQPKWIPIQWHDCTAEEREEYGFGEEIVTVFDCDMPSDNQEILVTTSHGYVEKDVCYIDDGYSLDSGYDWIEDITAWMPKPEPYKGE